MMTNNITLIMINRMIDMPINTKNLKIIHLLIKKMEETLNLRMIMILVTRI